MVVNSLTFLVFFSVVFAIYYLPVIHQYARRRNLWITLSSYFFYGFTDWTLALFLLACTTVFYGVGLWLRASMRQGNDKKASAVTSLGVALGVGVLLYFKYLNFFGESVATLLGNLGVQASWSTLDILLPIGVSFFTFKLISYIVDIHREKIDACDDYLEFSSYITFFPTIMSGPIDRPATFLPQLRSVKPFDQALAVDGCRQILWGVFTKMVIADNLAEYTSGMWADYASTCPTDLVWTILLSPVQVYADFDGYSNMAIGVGKLMGFRITRNFNHPFLARNVAEYWNRWHMSLTSWITDFIFMPLNIRFRNWGKVGVLLAVCINLVVIGLWHGANWTYAVFGLYFTLFFIPLVMFGKFGKRTKLKDNGHGLPLWKDVCRMVCTYIIVGVGYVLFFSKDVASAFDYLWHIVSPTEPWMAHLPQMPKTINVLTPLLLLAEWPMRKEEYALAKIKDVPFRPIRWAVYIFIIILIANFRGDFAQFIYFKF